MAIQDPKLFGQHFRLQLLQAAVAEAGEQQLREDYKNMTASRDRLWHEKREIAAATIERCAQIADTEEEILGELPPELKNYSLGEIIRATIRATKKSITRHIRALKGRNMTTRQEVYAAIDGERSYQDQLGPSRTDGHQQSVGDYITMMQNYQRKLVEAWTDNPGDEQALHIMRKIAAIAVRCMEDHGAAIRVLKD